VRLQLGADTGDTWITQEFGNFNSADRATHVLFGVDLNVDPNLAEAVDLVGNVAVTLTAETSPPRADVFFAGVLLANGGGGGDVLSCIAEGACIRMADGSERAVETLRAGDAVVNRHGAAAVVRGLYQGVYTPSLLATDVDDCPMRVPAGRFGPGRPYADLYLSPKHSILFTAGCTEHAEFIPTAYFRFEQHRPSKPVRVFQVHTSDCHGVIANGLPVSNWSDADDRSFLERVA
jgi:hypothetical protein